MSDPESEPIDNYVVGPRPTDINYVTAWVTSLKKELVEKWTNDNPDLMIWNGPLGYESARAGVQVVSTIPGVMRAVYQDYFGDLSEYQVTDSNKGVVSDTAARTLEAYFGVFPRFRD